METECLRELLGQHDNLKDGIFIDIPITNAPKEVREASMAINVSLHNRQTDQITHIKPQEFEKEGVFPHLVFYRVYLHDSLKQLKPNIQKACDQAFGQSTGTLQVSEFRLVLDDRERQRPLLGIACQ